MVEFAEKNMITTTFYFPAEEKSVCIRKTWVSVNSTGQNLDGSFFNTCRDFYKGKTGH